MMKNLILGIRTYIPSGLVIASLIFCLTQSLSAQLPLPNGSFESWTTYMTQEEFPPFQSSNGFSFFLAGEPAVWSVPGKVGQTAVHMETKATGPLSIMPGSIVLGKFCDGSLASGAAYPHQPDSLTFWMRRDIKPGDDAVMYWIWDGGPVNFRFFSGTELNWTRINIPLSPPANADTLLIALYSSSDVNNGTPGSWIEIDELEMHGAGVPQLVNAGFETIDTLSYENPDEWGTANETSTWFSDVQTVTKSTDAAEGNYAVRLETTALNFDCNSDTIGSLNSGGNYLGDPTNPFPYDGPFSIQGKYKYSSPGTDQGVAVILFYAYDSAGNANVAQTAGMALAPAATYTDFEIDVDTTGWGMVPDSFHIVFAPSFGVLTGNPGTPVGSVLLIDDMNIAVGNEPSFPRLSTTIFPNPAEKELFVQWDAQPGAQYHIRIIDVQGRLLRMEHAEAFDQTRVNLEGLNPGFYFLELADEHGNSAIRQFIKE